MNNKDFFRIFLITLMAQIIIPSNNTLAQDTQSVIGCPDVPFQSPFVKNLAGSCAYIKDFAGEPVELGMIEVSQLTSLANFWQPA